MEIYPKPIKKKCHQKILEQMNELNNSICKINNNEIGIFCNIKYNHKIIQVIIINNNINSDEYLNKIKVIINNREEIINIEKILYKDIKQNISIIKIKTNNKNIKYLELDDNLYKKESELYYNNESIYILQNKDNDILVSYGIIKEIHNNEIIYKGNVNSNYSLIFNLNNNKLIGINKDKTNFYNKGICFNNLIKEIKNYNNYNEINILVEIKKENINKKVYFINDNGNDLNKFNDYNTELYINNKSEKYKTYFISENIGINNIILKFEYELKNIKNMFRGCINITEINFINFNSKNIENMQFMFYKCINLKKINFNNTFDTINVKDMSFMLYNCRSLTNLPDISIWDTKNVKDMSYMFSGCSLLNNLPDISKWKTKNVENMSYMFTGCNSLYNLPDISIWDTNNVKDMNYMFDGCSLLKNIPKKFLNK